MEIRLLQSAQLDLDDGILYYEGQMKQLGVDFLDEILLAFNRIQLNPEAWSPFSDRTRRCLVHRFPYGVIYQIRNDEVLIIAIAHLRRNPNYWQERI